LSSQYYITDPLCPLAGFQMISSRPRPCDLLVAPVVKASGPRISVASESLNIGEVNALREQVGDDRNAERVRG
jgi:hypothetical protein